MSLPDRFVQANSQRAALLSILALILVASGSQAGLITHFLIGKLVYSTSDAATLFFLGYAALALAWSAVSRHMQISPRVLIGMLVVCLLAGHVTNLVASVHYFRGHGLPLDAHVHHWLGSDNSYTSMMHSHLGKPSLALTAKALGFSSGRYDTGAALSGSLPIGITAMIGGSFLIGMVAAVALFPGLMARLDWHPAAVILYLVTSSLCLKTLLDGGPLSYRVPPSALLLASLLLTTNREHLQGFWCGPGWKLAFVLTAAYLLLWMQLSAGTSNSVYWRPAIHAGCLWFAAGLADWPFALDACDALAALSRAEYLGRCTPQSAALSGTIRAATSGGGATGGWRYHSADSCAVARDCPARCLCPAGRRSPQTTPRIDMASA